MSGTAPFTPRSLASDHLRSLLPIGAMASVEPMGQGPEGRRRTLDASVEPWTVCRRGAGGPEPNGRVGSLPVHGRRLPLQLVRVQPWGGHEHR